MAEQAWGPVTVMVDGREHHGRYRVEGETLFVETPYGAFNTRIGNMRPAVVAQSLLLTDVTRGLAQA